MKRGTPNHPKTLALTISLGISKPTVIGHLEMLWHWAAEYAPRGDIGKYSPAQIAIACAWEGDSALFMTALIEAGWLDSDSSAGVLIHDWPDHADEYVHAKVARRLELFANGERPSTRKLNVVETKKFNDWCADAFKAPLGRRKGAVKGDPKAYSRSRSRSPSLKQNIHVEKTDSTTDAVREVVAFYNQITGRRLTPATHAKTIEPRLTEGVPVVTLKLATIGACLSPYHVGLNDQATVYLDPATIYRPARLDGHADRARRATCRLERGEEVWEYWHNTLQLGRAAIMERFFRARDELLIQEGGKPIGPSAMRSDSRVGEPWPELVTA